MSGDFETLDINQPKITYLKPEENTEWLAKLINIIEDMKNKISKNFYQKIKKDWRFRVRKSYFKNYGFKIKN